MLVRVCVEIGSFPFSLFFLINLKMIRPTIMTVINSQPPKLSAVKVEDQRLCDSRTD